MHLYDILNIIYLLLIITSNNEKSNHLEIQPEIIEGKRENFFQAGRIKGYQKPLDRGLFKGW
jgi:hypothetical protein